jgi:hypothetical protein
LLALSEWQKARQLVGPEIVTACEAWARRLTKFERVSAFEAAEQFKASLLAKAKKRTRDSSSAEVKLPKSYAVVLKAFQAKFGDRYLDDLKKLELDEWFMARGESGWTQNTYPWICRAVE